MTDSTPPEVDLASQHDLTARRDAAVKRLMERINYEQWQSPPYNQRDFKLDRMRILLERIGNPQSTLKIIHIAGTKGKGSTAAMIGAVLSSARLRTGLFSSPHLDRLEERVAIDGRPISAAKLVELLDALWPAVEQMDRQAQHDEDELGSPTYFEITTALALLHFQRESVDAAILEVGLGGRLDSTNVCEPVVSVITNISLDHTQQLGATLAAIAREKAGVIKPGVPIVSGVTPAEPQQVIREVAATQGAKLIELGVDFQSDYHRPNPAQAPSETQNSSQEQRASGGSSTMDYRSISQSSPDDLSDATSEKTTNLAHLEIGLLGAHQAENAAVAVATLLELAHQGWTIPTEAIRHGLANVSLAGRVERLADRPIVVIDTAHNVASIQALVATLQDSFPTQKKTLLFSTPKDKDIAGMFQALAPVFDRVVLTRYQNNPRSTPLDELLTIARQVLTHEPECFEQPSDAWRHLRQTTGEDELICVTGSFFLAAEVRPLVITENRS